MIPRTVSASSLNTADLCLARYKAENLMFTPSPAAKVAANIGTSCHGALQDYVQAVYIDKSQEPSWHLLELLYQSSYLKTFDTVEHNTPEYKDGLALLKTWFERTDLSGRTILSVEKKRRLPIPTSAGPIPMTYIIDRLDIYTENGRTIVEVVDYKTIRAMLSADDVRGKLQARIYDLAVRAQMKAEGIHYDEVRVIFDLLRHEQVGVVYTREEAEETWASILARVERIIAASEERPPETLNAECGYCVRKLQCATLRKNILGGGVFSVADDLARVAAMRLDVANQVKGLEAALSELDTILIQHAQQEDVLAFSEDGYKVSISARKTRNVDSVAAARILGPEVMARHGKITVGVIDKLREAGEISPEQEVELGRAMGYSVSAPSVRVTPKK